MKHINIVTCILKHKDKILLIKRGSNTPFYADRWGFVCGTVEKKEKSLEAALREIKEETRLTQGYIKLVKQGKLIIAEDKSIDVVWYVNPFLFEGNTDKVTLDWENTECAWIKPEELLDYWLVPGMIQVTLKLMGNVIPERKGILAIVYRNNDSFLIVKTKTGNVTFVSGGIEKGESEEDAVIHEVKEEGGIEIKKHQIKKLPLVNKFTYKRGFLRGISSSQNVYSVKVYENTEINLRRLGTTEAKWMTKDEVRNNLTFDHIKEIFEKSLEYIK